MAVSALSYAQNQSVSARSLHVALAGGEMLPEMWEFLRVSELMMLDLVSGRPPNPEYRGKGHPEFGCLLHYLHHPPAALMAAIGSGTPAEAGWKRATDAAKPMTTVAPGFLERARQPCLYAGGTRDTPSVCGRDGAWQQALVDFFTAPGRARHDFGSAPYVGPLRGRAGQVCLAVVGGDVSCPQGEGALTAMKQMRGVGCDYVFHLGAAVQAWWDGAWPDDAGDREGMRAWRSGINGGRMFALNSSLAMCDGGERYFGRILGADAFKHQNRTSYFAAHYGKWVILGLDTAYQAPAASLYTQGVLGEEQNTWIRQLRRDMGGFEGRRLLVLTHHEGQDVQGTRVAALHAQLVNALGRAPDVWYWAQSHSTLAYSSASAAGREGVKARCVGHSASPCALVPALVDAYGHPIASLDYFSGAAGRAYPHPGSGGFATLELGEGGSLVEKLYAPERSTPVWQSVNGIRFA